PRLARVKVEHHREAAAAVSRAPGCRVHVEEVPMHAQAAAVGRIVHPAVAAADPEVAGLLDEELSRQSGTISLIPSENYVSAAVLDALGSVFTNKYSEGYAGKRYYEGQQVVDRLEPLAAERAQRLFGSDHANVQPYSGSPANLAVYYAFMKPGDTVLAMSLPMGGHLTHGGAASITGNWFRPVGYGVRRDTGLTDLDEVRELALRERPK